MSSESVPVLDRTRKQGIFNLCFQYEVEDTLDIAVVSVRRETLEQDGARHGVHGYVCGLHAVEDLPSANHDIRKDASAQERAH